MGNRMVFCPERRQNVRYSVKKSMEEAKLRGEAYEIVTHTPYSFAHIRQAPPRARKKHQCVALRLSTIFTNSQARNKT
jgi:hypothetical protein